MVRLLDLPTELLECIFLKIDPLDLLRLHSKITRIITDPIFLKKKYGVKNYRILENNNNLQKIFHENFTKINILCRLMLLKSYPKIITNNKMINYLLYYGEFETVKKLIRLVPKDIPLETIFSLHTLLFYSK